MEIFLSPDQQKALRNLTVAGIVFDDLGAVSLTEGETKCPFCGCEGLSHHPEHGVGGHQENLQSSCRSCGFSQSPADGRLVVPQAWHDANLR